MQSHAVLGVGGVGGLLAMALSIAGCEVSLLLREQAIATYPEEVSLQSPFGAFRKALPHAVRLTRFVDCVWVTVKGYQLEHALPQLGDGSNIGTVVPLLNGIDHVAELRARFGSEKVMPATIAVESELVAPGVIVHRSAFARLVLPSAASARFTPLTEKLRVFGFNCEFAQDEATLLWGKLAFLAPLALTTTARAATKGEIVADPEWRNRLYESAAEVTRVAQACGASLDAVAIVSSFDRLSAGMRSSMEKDVAARRAPELDAIAGPILREAAARGIAVPVTRELTDMVHNRMQARAHHAHDLQ